MEIQKLFSVKDKVVVITGGGRGIGKMMAESFVRNHAKVYIASRDIKTCNETANALNAMGPGSCVAIQANLSTEEGCQLLANEIGKKEQKVDVLINNSAAAFGGDFQMHDEKAWNRVLSLNVKSPFYLTRELLPLLDNAATSSDSARVIFIGSIAGHKAQRIPTTAYDVSKAAVHHMTRILATKLSQRPNGGHILVNAIAPGLVPTKMSKGIEFASGSSLNDLASYIPLQRTGNETDMAGAAIFLASKASSYITGTIITVDGGLIFANESKL